MHEKYISIIKIKEQKNNTNMIRSERGSNNTCMRKIVEV